ncbi:MAG: hypothetical protein M3Y37_06240, partial [Chloroflexota bacterium]|nr:hypothetical protein [Chloroflexota bacterium]
MVERWGAWVVKRALAVLLIGFVVIGISGFLGMGLEDKLSGGGFDDPATESSKELSAERETFGNNSIDAITIYTSEELEATDPEFRQEVEETLAALPQERVA